MNDALKIVEFMDTVEKLCYVKRKAKRNDGSNENDSDHIMRLCFLVMMVSEYIKKPVNKKKLLEIALVHDLVEAETGDFNVIDQISNPEIRKEKKKAEKQAIDKYRKLLPDPLGDKIYELFMEYEAQETIESKIVYALDKQESDLHANKEVDFCDDYYEKPGYKERIEGKKEHKFLKMTNEEIIGDIENLLFDLSMKNMEKCKKIKLLKK